MLIPVTTLLGGAALVVVALVAVALIWFFSVRAYFMPYRSGTHYLEVIIVTETYNTASFGFTTLTSLANEASIAVSDTIQTAWNYAILMIASALVAALGLAVLLHHKEMVESYHVLSQCGIAPLRDKFVFNIVNMVTLLYDMFNPLIIVAARLLAFLEFGWIPIVLSCSDTSLLWNALGEIGRGLNAFFGAFQELVVSNDPLDERFDLEPMYYHFGRAVSYLQAPLDCLAHFFDFLWAPLVLIPSYPSIHVTLDCGWNALVRIPQAIFRPFFGRSFMLSPWADEAGCMALSLADVAQDLGLQVIQILTGVFSEVATPCEVFNGSPSACSAVGHCTYDSTGGRCRALGHCDAYGSRDACTADPICCFSANINATSHKIDFSCSNEFFGTNVSGQCPADPGCSSIPNAATCNAFNGTCAWDPRISSCVNHADICTGLEDIECRTAAPYCSAFPPDATCMSDSRGLCTVSAGQCVSYAQLCFDDPLISNASRNRTCLSYQMCGWNVTVNRTVVCTNDTSNVTTCVIANETYTGTCMPRDLNDTITSSASTSAATAADDHAARVALNIPGADAPPDTIGKLLGVPIILAVMEIQWAHTFPPTELAVGLMRFIVQLIDNIFDANNAFGKYDGIARWRIGYLFDYVRSWMYPMAQIGVLLDLDLPCVLQSLLQVAPDLGQGIAELFLLLVYFSSFQPTGPANVVNAWLPIDYLSSYYNDTRVSFMPLIFINDTVWQLERVNDTAYKRCHPDGTEFGKRSSISCSPNDGRYYDIEIDVDTGTILFRPNASTTLTYNWTTIASSNTSIRRVYIFPGLDRTIPRIIKDIQDSTTCLERVIGNGTNRTQDTAPWACFIRHLINVLAEILNVLLQIVAYIGDIIRFTDDPIYRHTALDVTFEGIFSEWEAMTQCFANMIRLGDPAGVGIYGLCTTPESTLRPDGTYSRDRFSIVCCLANLSEAIMNGALVVALNELLLFIREFIGVKFLAPPQKIPHIPDLNLILNKVEILIDDLACVMAGVIPDAWKCNMTLQFEEPQEGEDVWCRVISERGNPVPCGYMRCKQGNQCVARFLSSIIRFIILTIPRAFSLVYSTIRRLALNTEVGTDPCTQYGNNKSECERNTCQWNIKTSTCIGFGTTEAASAGNALQQIVALLSDLSTMVFTGALSVVSRLALVFDCIRCTAVNLNDPNAICRQGSSLTDTSSGTPMFDFVVFLLTPILNIIKQLIKMVITLAIFGITILVIIFTGNFDALDVMLVSFGDALKSVIAQLASNIFGIVLKALGLDKIYNAIVNIINDIVIAGCNFINDACSELSLGCHLPCPAPLAGIPTGTSADYPAINCTDYSFDPDGCNAWGTRCIYEGSECRERVGCEKGINRDTCAPIDGCMWRTTANTSLSGGRNLRARECVNMSTVGIHAMPAGNTSSTILIWLDRRFSFNRAPCTGRNETECNAVASVCNYDTDHGFCYHRQFSRLCERRANDALRPVDYFPDVRSDVPPAFNPVPVCRDIYEMNQTTMTAADETCIPTPVSVGSFSGTMCTRTLTDPCNFYEDSGSCNAFRGLCYWSESSQACMSGRELCMTHTTTETCGNMTSLCSFADGNFNACNASELQDLCKYDAATSKCMSRAAYCQKYEGTSICQQYFSCAWDPLGVTAFTSLDPAIPPYNLLKPRCVTIDMMERLPRIPGLHTNKVMSVATAFYQRSKRDVALDRDVVRRMVALEEPMQWPEGDPCARVMDASAYGGNVQAKVDALFAGAFEPFGEYMYCFGRQLWARQATPPDAQLRHMLPVELLRDTGATGTLSYPGQPSLLAKMTQGDCDVLYNEYYNASTPMPWSELRPLERVTLVECTKNRMYGLYLRQLAGYMWLPEDLVDNPYRKYMLLLQAANVLRVYGAYKEERSIAPEILLDPLYAQRMSAQGLATMHLVGLRTVEDVQAMLARVSVVDYFAYNGMGAREAQMAVDLGALLGSALSGVTSTLSNALGRLPYNTSSLSLGHMFANGTATTLGQVAVSSLAASASALVEVTNTTFQLATDAQTYKRAASAAKAMGQLIYDASQTFLAWSGRLDPNTTTLSDGQTLVDPAPPIPDPSATVASAWLTKANEVKSSIVARASLRLAAARNLVWRNAAAAERREKLAFFGEMVAFVIKGQLVIPLQHTTHETRSTAYKQLRSATSRAVLAYKAPHMSSFASRYDTTMSGLLAPVPCLTGPGGDAGNEISTTWFCTEFIWLDGLLGRIVLLGKWLVRYYRGAPSDGLRVNFPDSYARFKAYASYVSNDTARVRVGDSYDNPVLWPYHNRSSWHLFGDTTPNKTRLYDYESLFVELFESLKMGVSEPSSLRVIELIDSGLNALFVRSSGALWSSSVHVAYYAGIVSNTTRDSLLDRSQQWRAAKLAAIRPVGDILKDLAERLFSQLVTCSFPVHNEQGEIDGSQKRFALAEMLVISILLVLALFVPLMILFPNSLFSLAAGLGIIMTVVGVVFLSVTYNWSYLCFPALPMPLADDIRDAIGFNIAPKCNVMLSGSFYTPYNATNCYTCANARTQRSRHCVRDLNITSLYDNLALITVMHFPALPDTLRDLGLGSLVDKYTTFGERVAKFQASFNPNDPVSYANHWTCNWFYTVAPYVAMIQFGFLLLIIGAPALYFAASVVRSLWAFLVRSSMLGVASLQYVQYVGSAYPYMVTYGSTPDDDAHGTLYDDDGDGDEDGAAVEVVEADTTTVTGSFRETLYNNALAQTLGMVLRRRPTPIQAPPATRVDAVEHATLLNSLRRGDMYYHHH